MPNPSLNNSILNIYLESLVWSKSSLVWKWEYKFIICIHACTLNTGQSMSAILLRNQTRLLGLHILVYRDTVTRTNLREFLNEPAETLQRQFLRYIKETIQEGHYIIWFFDFINSLDRAPSSHNLNIFQNSKWCYLWCQVWNSFHKSYSRGPDKVDASELQALIALGDSPNWVALTRQESIPMKTKTYRVRWNWSKTCSLFYNTKIKGLLQ